MHEDDPVKHAGKALEDTKGARVIAYNVSEEERPGGPDGLKVRWKWRIETGRRAAVKIHNTVVMTAHGRKPDFQGKMLGCIMDAARAGGEII